MPLRVNNNILNQKGTPAFYSDVFSARPAFGFAGRVFISTDTGQIFEDTGTAWTLLADAGVGGGTLASVTANGNTTATGIVITANGLSTNSVTNTSLTSGSVLFSGTAGLVSQDNANLFWDDTNNRLGISTTTPGAKLDIHGTGTIVQLNGTGANNAYLQFQNAGVNEWRIGNNYNAGANSFELFNNGVSAAAFSVDNTLNNVSFTQNINIKNSGTFYITTGYSSIGCDSGGFFFNNGTANTAYLNFIGLTSSQSFTFPNASGTLATTANLSSYLPLAGGTMTGALLGTTATFSSSVNISNTGGAMELSFKRTDSPVGTGAIYFRDSSDNIDASISHNVTVGAGLEFGTAGSNRMYINSSGQVLINTTSSFQSTETLCVYNNNNTAIFGKQGGGASTWVSKMWNDATTGDNRFVEFLTETTITARGSITYSRGSGLVLYNTTSDYRLKTEITDFNALYIINNLKPKEFKINNSINKSIGFIAHELQEFYPQAVTGVKDEIDKNGNPIYQCVDYSQLTGLLVKAIQELNEKLERNNIN